MQEALPKGGAELERVQRWLTLKVNGKRQQLQRLREEFSPWQLGCPELVPKLSSRPVWDPTAFAWTKDLEAAFPDIRAELMGLKGQKGFQVGLLIPERIVEGRRRCEA
jgi:hypothetical protein